MYTDEQKEAITEAARILGDIQRGVQMLSSLWYGEHTKVLDELLTEDYPESLPSFDDFECEVDEWESAVAGRAEQMCGSLKNDSHDSEN